MYIYSDTYKLCECGLPTHLTDESGKELHTGDQVIIFNLNNGDVPFIGEITAIVIDQFGNWIPSKAHEKQKPYIMGIKDAPVGDKGWSVRLHKKYTDCIIGEHWPNCNFNYRED